MFPERQHRNLTLIKTKWQQGKNLTENASNYEDQTEVKIFLMPQLDNSLEGGGGGGIVGCLSLIEEHTLYLLVIRRKEVFGR